MKHCFTCNYHTLEKTSNPCNTCNGSANYIAKSIPKNFIYALYRIMSTYDGWLYWIPWGLSYMINSKLLLSYCVVYILVYVFSAFYITWDKNK